MEVNDYLIVYGHCVQRGYPCYKETQISCDELVNYMPVIKRIYEKMNELVNWAGGRTIERTNDGKYIEHVHLYEMYPEFPHELLDKLSELFPSGITKIESIKIFSGQKIKII